MASATGVAKTDIENMIEGRLVRLGYIERTPKGRILSSKCIGAYKYLMA